MGLVLLIALLGIQFLPTTRNQSDMVPKTDSMMVNKVPKTIQNKLQVSCYDCHSNNTEYPWYNKIQPVAWYLEDHVSHGKEEFNFSEFENYSDRRKKSKLKSFISQVEKDKMPLESYTLINRDAKISDSEKELVLSWVNKLLDSI